MSPSPPEVPNPWLVSSTRAIQKKHEVAISKDSASAEKSKNKLRKRVKNLEEETELARNDATVDISLGNVMTLGVGSRVTGRSENGAARMDTSEPSKDTGPEDDSDLNSEVDEQEHLLDRKGKGRAKGGNGVKAFAQRDLVAQAFAGDNVVQVWGSPRSKIMP